MQNGSFNILNPCIPVREITKFARLADFRYGRDALTFAKSEFVRSIRVHCKERVLVWEEVVGMLRSKDGLAGSVGRPSQSPVADSGRVRLGASFFYLDEVRAEKIRKVARDAHSALGERHTPPNMSMVSDEDVGAIRMADFDAAAEDGVVGLPAQKGRRITQLRTGS